MTRKTQKSLSRNMDAESLKRHMAEDDPLGLVLRAHLYAENVVLTHLESAASNPKLLHVDRLPFLAKVEISAALGFVHPNILPVAKCLNTLRNMFAHNLNSKLRDDLKRNLYNSLPKHAKKVALEGRDRKKRYRRIIDIPFGFLLEIAVNLFEAYRLDFVEMKESEKAAMARLRKVLDKSKARRRSN